MSAAIQFTSEMLTTNGAAEVLCVHPQTIRRMIRGGRLKAYNKPGKGTKVFLKKEDVIALQTFEPASGRLETKSKRGKK